MKRLLLVALLVLLLFTTSSAELSIVWDHTYMDYEMRDLRGLVPLANGDFLYFYSMRESNPEPELVHAMRLDGDGTIIGTRLLATTMRTYDFFASCDAIDGGALAAILDYGLLKLYRWDATGALIDSASFPAPDEYRLSHMIQDPDGSVILVGKDPDLISIRADMTLNWYHDFFIQYSDTFAYQVWRNHYGLYGTEKVEDPGSGLLRSAEMFTNAGVIVSSHELYDGYTDITLCPDDYTVIYIRGRGGPSNPCNLIKRGEWSIDLPNDPSEMEWFRSVEPFNEVPGYLCSGYRPLGDAHFTGFLIEVAENGDELDLLEVDGLVPFKQAAAMNGDMIVGCEYVDQDYDNFVRVVRVSPGQSHAAVSVKAWLYNAPVRVWAGNSTLHTRILIGNDLDEPTDVTLNLIAYHPDYGDVLLNHEDFTLVPNEPVVLTDYLVYIAYVFPTGQYELTAQIVDENGLPLSHSMVTFSKAPPQTEAAGLFEEPFHLANEYALSSIYPNPFNAVTTISVTLPETSNLTVRVFDIQGRTVATLADGVSIAAGSHTVSFDGSDLSSGIYFVQATVPGQLSEVRKLVLVK